MSQTDNLKYHLPISKSEIEAAHARIKPYIHRTPVLRSAMIDELAGCEIHFKCENFQKVGAFKSRGAMNAVLTLSESELSKGVCTHSSGNHAQALARAASLLNIPAYIVMPHNAPAVKINAVRQYKGEIFFCEPTQAAREKTLETVMQKTHANFIHPYNNLQVIAGQASAAKELIEDTLALDYILAPVGGGGLLSGTALSNYYFCQNACVIGAEPYLANDAFQSMKEGKIIEALPPLTIADGLLTSLGTFTFPIIQALVSKILNCTEEQIVNAMQLIYERLKIVVEPSAAVGLAVVLANPSQFKDQKVGIILSGGNLNLKAFYSSFEV
jgi:threonine dehydratase